LPQPFAYIPGRPPPAGGPLSRYLPPIPDGIAAGWLPQVLEPGQWVWDPFGSAPRLASEAARAGYRVLSAVNNPIARFLFELHAHPPQASELRSTLSDLAGSQKAGQRLEPHIRGLYQTICAACGQPVEAQAFVWEKGGNAPVARIYTCPACKDSGERPATPLDIERAARFAPGELHRARALERVTPISDPDRVYAEEALEMYLPRAVYVLFTLVNKLEGLPPARRPLLATLLLAAMDQANRLWASQPNRLRPRQLTPSNRYLEKNIWLALEEAVEAWPASLAPGADGLSSATESLDSAASPGANPNAEPPEKLPLTIWPELPPQSGGICLFEGRLKDLADLVGPAGSSANEAGPDLRRVAVLAALPRPNQAYWTLSALWAGWLWGHEAKASFNKVLRRRRYDWNWHAEALHAALRSLAHILPDETPFLGWVSEAEPAFLSTALLAAKQAGFALEGLALRLQDNLAQIAWRSTLRPIALSREVPGQDGPTKSGPSSAGGTADTVDGISTAQTGPVSAPPGDGKKEVDHQTAFIQRAVQAHLHRRGEPTTYPFVHAAALQAMIESGRLPQAVESPADLLQKTESLIEKAFHQPGQFVRYGAGGRTLDSGLWWSEAHLPGSKAGQEETDEPFSLADRVEMEVVRYLLKNPDCTAEALDEAMCRAHPALLTPERELILECLRSYGECGSSARRWHLRTEDTPSARRAELEHMREMIQHTGERLGYTVAALPLAPRSVLVWRPSTEGQSDQAEAQPEGSPPGQMKRKSAGWAKPTTLKQEQPPEYWVYIPASAVRTNVLLTQVPGPLQRFVVLPGGRARLVAFKLRRDPRLRAAAEQGWQFIKFRHLRRLAGDEGLSQANLAQLLALDPLDNSDPQLSLF